MIASNRPFGLNQLRAGFSQFPTGVVAICAEVSRKRLIMLASSFVCVSLDPPLVAFCAQRVSETWPKLRTAPRLGVSILGEPHASGARKMASKAGDRFEGITTHVTTDGAGLIEGAAAWFEVSLSAEIPAGDHMLALMQVENLQVTETNPIVYHQNHFHQLKAASGR